MKLIKEAITGWFGKKCSDYDKNCVVCQAWKELQTLQKVQKR